MVVRKRLTISGPSLFFVTTTVVDWIPVFADETIARQMIIQTRETIRHYEVGEIPIDKTWSWFKVQDT